MDRYEIRVAGHLDQRRAHSLGCEELRLLPDGDSLLIFAAVDQAALYGLLTRLRDSESSATSTSDAPIPWAAKSSGCCRTATRC